MVPVMGVALLYLQDGVPKVDRLPGLIVNRDAVDALNETLEETDEDAISLDLEFGITRRMTPTPNDVAPPEAEGIPLSE
jgi:hypothetical protein